MATPWPCSPTAGPRRMRTASLAPLAQTRLELLAGLRGLHAGHGAVRHAAALALLDLGLERDADAALALFERGLVGFAHFLRLQLHAPVDDELAVGRGGPSPAAGAREACERCDRDGRAEQEARAHG